MLREWLENPFEFEGRGSTIVIHPSNSFRYFPSFHPNVISREWLENTFELFFLFPEEEKYFYEIKL